VTYKTGFGRDDWIYYTLYIHNSGLQAIQRYRYSTHFAIHRCTRTRILSHHYSYPGNGLITVSLSLRITYEVFLSSLLTFLPLICSCQLNSIPLLPSSYPGRLASRNSTLHYRLLFYEYIAENFFIITLHEPSRKHNLYF
jgi:hypothetical protein